MRELLRPGGGCIAWQRLSLWGTIVISMRFGAAKRWGERVFYYVILLL